LLIRYLHERGLETWACNGQILNITQKVPG
jgi:hypothetical protein